MSFQTLKTGFLIAFCSIFIVACSSTPSDDSSGSASSSGSSSSGVSTGSVVTEPTYADDLGASRGVATVFYFDFDKSVLKAEARAALNIHAQGVKSSGIYVRLEGHADERGTREYNMALGERRAKAVKEYLVLQGVSPAMMEVISYGEERAAALGSDEGSWALNRRVELQKR